MTHMRYALILLLAGCAQLPPRTAPESVRYLPASYEMLPGWGAARHAASLQAFLAGCPHPALARACEAAPAVPAGDDAAARRYFESTFDVYALQSPEGADTGLVTGYYEPLIAGSRTPSAVNRVPIHGVPDDLKQLVPYYTRGEIDARGAAFPAPVIAWVADPVELFFLHVQGSGLVSLPDGERIRVGFADTNDHPYRSVGRFLIERGELTLEQASMQGIKVWAAANPRKLPEVLAHNARYVFFRELASAGGPIGALGAPLTAEYSMAATYLDWALNLPWNDYTVDNEDTREIPRILDEDHHGLPKPKQRVIEFIAAKSFNSGIDNPILCFIGPPGVGKTSLGKSIARALGRKFWRISVGGIHDESEIRGHRRTYVGAEPGRIISTMRRVGKRNPVFMIDEIDKLFGGGAQGSARDAMLEVLDPEQYHNFVDNYLEFGFDLSSILFITTANNIESIPPALRDRMEFIFFPSYNHNEKKHIAREFLIPKQLARHGLTPDSKMFRDGLLEAVTVNITDSVLDVLIGEMTFEAGVRELDRVIGKVMRKVVWKMKNQNSSRQPNVERTDVAAEDGAVWEINERNLSLYIEDAARISKRHALSEDPLPCGVAPIVAVSDTGGSIFYVEAAYRKSEKREIKITGYNPHDEKLGRMLRDSAHKAWDFLFRESGLLNNLGVEEKIYLHITFSNGGIAKDGPSAGISLVLALYSKFTNQPVRHGLVATGENTLALGKILPVGGITNKITTAVRAGAKQFLMPRANEAELADVPEETKNQIEIILCDSMIDALKVAFPNCPRLHDAISNQ